MSVRALRELCEKSGLRRSGTKTDLIDRLREQAAKEEEDAAGGSQAASTP